MDNLNRLNQLQKLDSHPEEEELVQVPFSPLQTTIKDGQPLRIGVCGGHSAGKAMFVSFLKQKLEANYKLLIIKQESFEINNFDEENFKPIPFVDSQDWKNFRQKAHEALDSKSDQYQIVILEGTLILWDETIRNKLDFKIYLDADSDVRLSRKIYKEVYIKGGSMKNVVNLYLQKLKPIFETFINPSKRYADVLVPNYGGGFSLARGKEYEGFEDISHQFQYYLLSMINHQFSLKGQKKQ
ncbi:hypothetical protein pb186bvf_005695 [Paramecium bursaria]